MTSLSNIATTIFNRSEESSLSTETRIAGFVVATALIAFSIYLRCSSSNTRPHPARNDTSVVRDGPRTFEYVSTPTNLLLEYRGGSPNEANEALKQAIAQATKSFLSVNNREILHQLPEFSTFDSLSFCSDTSSFQNEYWNNKVTHRIDKNCNLYSLEINIGGQLPDDQWRSIQNQLLDFRKAFSLTSEYFS